VQAVRHGQAGAGSRGEGEPARRSPDLPARSLPLVARAGQGAQRRHARSVGGSPWQARQEPAEEPVPRDRGAVLGGRDRPHRHPDRPRPLTGECRLGVLAFGDSITNGGGELQWGVALQSWALWVARGLGLPYTGYAVDGARASDVLRAQLPAWRAVAGDARYDLGCLYIGVNDVRAADWNPAAFAVDHEAALAALREHCDRVLAVLIPLDLGRPRARGVERANALIEAAAARHGALVLDLRGFGARNHVMTDHVHPTAFGQVAIAERALELLAAAGMGVRVRPSALISPASSSRARALQGDWTYVYRRLKVLRAHAWAAALRAARAARARSDSSPRRG
jgi:lysophospholipase L1-like esterase